MSLATQAMAVVVPATAFVGAGAPQAGTGLRGQFFDSGGTVASMQGPAGLLALGTTPNRVWNVTTVDYPQGGAHNTASDANGLRNFLGTDANSLQSTYDIANIDNSRFAMRGYIQITAAMDRIPGGNIDINLRLDSDDDGNIVFGGGTDADGTTGTVGLNLPRNTTHALEFATPGFYQFDVIYQEGGGLTGATLQIQRQDLAGGALTIVPQAQLVPDTAGTPAPTAAPASTAVPGSALAGVQGATSGLAAQFFDSQGDLTSIRNLLNTNTAPDRRWVVSTVDYPQGGAHNTAADASGLFNLIGTDQNSVTGGGNIADVNASRFAFRGYLQIASAMDMDPTLAGIQIMLRLDSDDDGNIVFGGGQDANGTTPVGSGLNLGRNLDHYLTFSLPGAYQMDILWQESTGNTGATLRGQFANINNGAFSVVPNSIIFQGIAPEPASLSMLILGGLGLMRRRNRA